MNDDHRCDHDPADCPGHEIPAYSNVTSLGRRFRFWLIRQLARGDAIGLNANVVTPPGWAWGKVDPDAGAMFTRNHLAPGGMTWIPGTLVISLSEDDS